MAENWFVGTLKSDSGTRLVRAMSALPTEASRAENPNLVIVRWTYAGDDMPDRDAQEAIFGFENVIFEAIENEGWAIDGATLTGCGVKEWRFYTLDVGIFLVRFNEALAGHAVYPLDFQSFLDPEWSGLSELQPN